MLRPFLLLLVLLAINLPAVQNEKSVPNQSAAGDKQAAETSELKPFKVPAEINLIVQVDELPGIANPQSYWEGFYELRVANWSAVVEKTRAGAGTRQIGEVLLRSSFPRRNFIDKENRRTRLTIPVKDALLARLQEQQKNPQAFLLRSTVRLFDAKLKRDYALEVNRIWQLKLFPDGEAKIVITIDPDGSYNVWGPSPKELPAGYTTIGIPPDKTPPSQRP